MNDANRLLFIQSSQLLMGFYMDEEDRYWSKLEKIYVHNVYESISSRYDDFFKISQQIHARHEPKDEQLHSIKNNNIRQKPANLRFKKSSEQRQNKHNAWPKVKHFLQQIDPYSLIADVGCGEGKYLNINSRLLTIGCDRSKSLSQLASDKHPPNSALVNQNQILVCDNLALPFRTNLFDAVISIGVIHHLSTEKRRIRALTELARILKPGGKIMIYVWAMEQRLRKFNSQDVLVPLLNTNTNNLPSNEVKFRLRRDLSNNSAANSEDSNDESYEQKCNYVNTINSNLANEKKYSESKQETENETKIKSSPEQSDENSNLNDSGEHSSNDLKETASTVEQSNRNFVENFKRFLVEKFSSSSNTKDCNSKPITENASSSSLSSLTSSSVPKSPIIIENKSSKNKVFFNLSSESSPNSIDRYKQIIEDHKDLLPENFTIRQFPYSSCQDTFEERKETSGSSGFSSSNSSTSGKSDENKLDLISVSSSSLSPSPTNRSPNFSSQNEAPNQAKPNENQSQEETTTLNDINNNLNKRFYHVFRQNELDRLIRENCSCLIIYDSYYDHGNWCICARKDKQPSKE